MVVAVVAAAPMVVAGLEVAATAGLQVAATLGLQVAGMSGSEVAASGLEVAAASGSSVDAEVAARSEGAAGSEVAGAAAAGSLAFGPMTTGTMTTGSVVRGPAAYPGERAARAKSHDLTAGLTEDTDFGFEAPQAPKRRRRSCDPSLEVIRGSCSRRRRPHLPTASFSRIQNYTTKAAHR